MRVENQMYIHYQKGSLVFYALQDYLGEDTVNRAIAAYIKEVAFQGPPYTTSLELLAHLQRVTPPELQYLITDLFETITLYDNRAVAATASTRADGRYDVRLTVSVQKVRADELGAEREVAVHDLIDVGIFGADGKLLYLDKHWLRAGTQEITVTVPAPPARAGVDPLHKLIDRKPDNVVRVDVGA